jgi:hypothetical protein
MCAGHIRQHGSAYPVNSTAGDLGTGWTFFLGMILNCPADSKDKKQFPLSCCLCPFRILLLTQNSEIHTGNIQFMGIVVEFK